MSYKINQIKNYTKKEKEKEKEKEKGRDRTKLKVDEKYLSHYQTTNIILSTNWNQDNKGNS